MAFAAISRASEWVREHPLEASLVGIGATAAGLAAYMAWTGDHAVFRKPPSVSFLESTGDHVDVRQHQACQGEQACLEKRAKWQAPPAQSAPLDGFGLRSTPLPLLRAPPPARPASFGASET